MQDKRRGLADRLRKLGIAIQEVIAPTRGIGMVQAQSYLVVDLVMADTALDGAQALDVIADARACLPGRIPRADMLGDPVTWVNLMNGLLAAIDQGVAPKRVPIPITPADVHRAAQLLTDMDRWAPEIDTSALDATVAKLKALAMWLERAGVIQQPDAEPAPTVIGGPTLAQAQLDVLADHVFARILQNRNGMLTQLAKALIGR